MYEKEKQQILACALKMERYQLISLSGGNVSMRMPDGNFLITPSAIVYDQMVPDDVVLVNEQGKLVDGTRRPSSDTQALLYIFKHMPNVNAIIHTHQPYATAVGLVTDALPACLVTIIDANNGAVNVAPFTISSDEGMGILTVKYAANSLAVILKNHGVIAFGKNLDEALASAVYLEESSKTYIFARSVGVISQLTDEQIAQEGAYRGYYGQPGK
jgi:L-ribulose-5-phosphate 4-epimerase